jgi:PAS domain S-box-containing protein
MREKAAVVGGLSQYCDLPGMKWLVTRWPLIVCALVLAASAHLSFAAQTSFPKTVLVLFSFTDRQAQIGLETLKSATRSHVGAPVNFHVEYLDSEHFGAPGYEEAVSESLASVYSGKRIDLVIVVFYPALRFALDHRDEIFPRKPIVFSSVARSRLDGQKLWPGVTGITLNADIHGTIDLALRVRPDTKNAAVVVGTSELDRYWLAMINQELRLHQPKLKVIDLAGLPPDQLLNGVAALAPHTIVLFQLIPEESAQATIGTYDILSTIAQQFQTYCFVDYCMGHGAIGGSYPDSVEQGREAGQLAARVLSGETPESIPLMQGPPALAHVDWRQLRRWNIPESALPRGTIIWYRPPTAWARYGKYVVSGFVLGTALALLIIGLVWQRARGQKGNLRLRESENRFRLMADTIPTLVWMCDKEGSVTFLNDRRLAFTGGDPAMGLGDDLWSAFIHPDDVESVVTANALALGRQTGFSKEYRLRRHDGVYRWLLDIAAPRINGDGSFAGFIGSAVDITDQKLAREALERIGGKLIEAQEEERRRIARELHDDICQRLALLSMELEQANRASNDSSGWPNAKIEEIRRHCAEIAADVQALSHKLHSSKLEYLGVVAAIRSFCREFSQQYAVNVDFTTENVPDVLSRDISLSLFRVTQEALHNAVKHSGVREFAVGLRGTAGEIQLEIRDRGIGFDVERAKQDRGLGLVSMQQRVHLVHGTFSIDSQMRCGTRIVVRVPLVVGTKSAVMQGTEA